MTDKFIRGPVGVINTDSEGLKVAKIRKMAAQQKQADSKKIKWLERQIKIIYARLNKLEVQ